MLYLWARSIEDRWASAFEGATDSEQHEGPWQPEHRRPRASAAGAEDPLDTLASWVARCPSLDPKHAHGEQCGSLGDADWGSSL